MKIKRFETVINASTYTTDTARRQLTSIQARYKDLTSIQVKLLASSRLTAGFTQNSLRDLMEMVAPIPVVYTTAKLITAVKVADKEEKPKAGGAKATKGKSDAEAIRKLMQTADPLTQAMSKKPVASEPKSTKVPTKDAEPKVTVESVLDLVDNFAKALDDAGEDDSTSDIIDSARTRAESLNLGKLSPKLVSIQRSILEKLGSVKTRGKLESFLSTEAENLRTAIKKFAEEQAPATKKEEAAEYNRSKFQDLLDEIETAEEDAKEPGGPKPAQVKTLLKKYLDEMHTSAFNSVDGDVEDYIEQTKAKIDKATTVKEIASASASGRKLLEGFVSDRVKRKLLKDSGKQEQAKVETKEPNKEEARKELSKAQLEFVSMMESYKKSNPTKYAQKEEGFIKKLNSL